MVLMHRVVAERSGLDLSHQIDHYDRNGLNNQRDNLRAATNKQNSENCFYCTNTSGHKGVVWCKTTGKWKAQICHNYKTMNLGRYKKKEDAIKARKEAEKKYFTHAV